MEQEDLDLDLDLDVFDETKILTNTTHKGYQRCLSLLENNPNTRDWRVLVELNAILNQNSIATWWYPYFLKEREEFMYSSVKPSHLKVSELRSELESRGLPTTGKKVELVSKLTANMETSEDHTLNTFSGKGNKKSKKELVTEYNRLYNQQERNSMRKPTTMDEYLNICVSRIVEEKYKDIILEPTIDILRDFLDINKSTINRLIRQIQPGHRSLLSWTELFSSPLATTTRGTILRAGVGGVRIGGLNQDSSHEESKKFANPLYTVMSLSDELLTFASGGGDAGSIPCNHNYPHPATPQLLPWFAEELADTVTFSGLRGSRPRGESGRQLAKTNAFVMTSDITRQSISDNSVKILKVLLEYIEHDVINSRKCISPIVDIIQYANMKYPNTILLNTNNLHHPHQFHENRITTTINTCSDMFELLIKFGLKDQGLTNLEFDVLGDNWRRVNSQTGLQKVMRYTDPGDPHSQFTRAQKLSLLCHPNLRKYWGEIYQTFDRKKIVNVARGMDDENSPLSYLDFDTFKIIGDNLKKDPNLDKTLLRRNTLSQGRNQDLISAMQRLNVSRGLKSLTSPIGEGMGVDMELIEQIINTQKSLNLIEDAKYSESKMTPENYTEPPSPQFQIGDSIMWGDGLKGIVIGTPKGNIKILGDNMKRYFLSGKTRNMKLIERAPKPLIDSLDGGSKRKTKRKTKKKTKRKTRKKKRTKKI